MALIHTNVDKLMDFISLKQGCTVDDACKALSMPAKKIEQTADTLAKSNLIEIKYGFTGIRLIPKVKQAKDNNGNGQAIGNGAYGRNGNAHENGYGNGHPYGDGTASGSSNPSVAIPNKAQSTSLERIENIRKELLQAENLIVFSEKEIRNKISRANAHFESLRTGDISYEEARISMGKMRDLEISLRALEEKSNSLGKAAFDIRQQMGGLEGMLEIRATNAERGSISPNLFKRIFARG